MSKIERALRKAEEQKRRKESPGSIAEKRADLTRGCAGSDKEAVFVAGRLGIDAATAAEIVRLVCDDSGPEMDDKNGQ